MDLKNFGKLQIKKLQIKKNMTSKERIYKTIKGEKTDRSPFALWRHFPNADQNSKEFAREIIKFQKKFNFDLVKVTPASNYFTEAFGAKFVYRTDKYGEQGGTRKCVFFPVKNHQDWQKLQVLNVNQGILKRELESIKFIKQELGKGAPIVQTIPNPLTLAKSLRGDNWIEDLKESPESLKIGLDIITKTVAKFCSASLKAGADGIFFFTQTASRDFLNEEEYKNFGMKYDLQILNKLKKQTDLLILHIHGLNIMFDLLKDYPVQIINWHDRLTSPSLAEAQKLFKGVVLGGINEKELLKKKPMDIKKQVIDALKQTDGRGIIIGPGCVIPINTPEANIKAIKEAL